MSFQNYLNISIRPIDLVKTIDYKLKHPDPFPFSGIVIFSGGQGSGKTLSAVKMIKSILAAYPEAIFCSNIDIKGVSNKTYTYEGVSSLTDVNNGEKGVIYLIDEGHLEFNSLESKEISVDEMEQIAQQRKQRKMIVMTTQVFTRLAKAFREQVRWVIRCSCFLGVMQWNNLIDGWTIDDVSESVVMGKVVKRNIFFHSPEMYDQYDTYCVIERHKEDWKKSGKVKQYKKSTGKDSVLEVLSPSGWIQASDQTRELMKHV